jgi:hypothetical protein
MISVSGSIHDRGIWGENMKKGKGKRKKEKINKR